MSLFLQTLWGAPCRGSTTARAAAAAAGAQGAAGHGAGGQTPCVEEDAPPGAEDPAPWCAWSRVEEGGGKEERGGGGGGAGGRPAMEPAGERERKREARLMIPYWRE